MKRMYLVFAVAVSVGFVSCFEAEEKTVINKDDSGTYNMSMDISGMMQQMQASASPQMLEIMRKDPMWQMLDSGELIKEMEKHQSDINRMTAQPTR